MEMNKAIIDCMRPLRRRLRDEMGLDIHLDQSDAISAMIEASKQSQDPQTHELGQRLAQASHYQAPSKASHSRQYRGQEPQDQEATGAKEETRPSVRMYRGQRVHG